MVQRGDRENERLRKEYEKFYPDKYFWVYGHEFFIFCLDMCMFL
jgi:hypothetical protein